MRKRLMIAAKRKKAAAGRSYARQETGVTISVQKGGVDRPLAAADAAADAGGGAEPAGV